MAPGKSDSQSSPASQWAWMQATPVGPGAGAASKVRQNAEAAGESLTEESSMRWRRNQAIRAINSFPAADPTLSVGRVPLALASRAENTGATNGGGSAGGSVVMTPNVSGARADGQSASREGTLPENIFGDAKCR